MEDMIETVRALAQEIGPRPPTSAAEAEAGAYVNARMRRAGLDVDVQTFRATPTSTLPYGLLYLAFALTPLLYYFVPPAALALSLLALFAFFLETLSFPVVSSWLCFGKSQNIIGTRSAAQEARQHLVVFAHLDSARASVPFHPRLVRGFRGTFLLQVVAMMVLPVLTGLGWGLGLSWLWYLQWLPAGYIAMFFLLLLHREIFMPYVAGANDNASGVAVLLHLAKELDNLQYTTLWLVASGCEESGLHGSRQFLRKYPFPRENTYVLNLDNVGQGEVCMVVEEGMLWSHRADSLLLEVAGRTDADDITIDAEPRTCHLMNTDAQVALIRGFRAMSLIALENGVLPNWHWPSDTIEQIEPSLLKRAARMALGIARRLDRMDEEGEIDDTIGVYA